MPVRTGRTRNRFISEEWIRDPEGELLTRPPPTGTRTPNGIIWGNSEDDFFWIRRKPGVNVMTAWSRSMIQQYGENYLNVTHPHEPAPHPLRPWPILMFNAASKWDKIKSPCSGHDSVNPSDLPRLDVNSNQQNNEVFRQHNDDERRNIATDVSTSKLAGTEGPTAEIVSPPSPKLEEFIPKEFFPDILLVNDPDRHTEPSSYGASRHQATGKQHFEAALKRYKRIWPKFPRDEALWSNISSSGSPSEAPSKVEMPRLNTASLDLASAPVIGTGHHSSVYRARLRLPQPLSANTPTGEVTVAAKTAFKNHEARELHRNEGKIYDAFPEHMMEDWSGLNLVSPIVNPVPVGAVVPKFYGYYVLDREYIEAEIAEKARLKAERKRVMEERQTVEALETREGKENSGESGGISQDTLQESNVSKNEGVLDTPKGEDDQSDDSDSEADAEIDWDRQSPLLLLEECGSPIEPHTFTADHRSECYSLLLRFHHAQFDHNSFYIRNILSQPGPLTAPPSQRSSKTPSFRIIDFGRSNYWKYFLEEKLAGYGLGKGSKGSSTGDQTENQDPVWEACRRSKIKTIATEWKDSTAYDARKAQEELQIMDFDL